MFNLGLHTGWHLDGDTEVTIDAQLFLLIRAVHETGKLTRATEQIAISYRHGWNLLDKWSKAFDCPIVEKQKGRGATLTAFGEKLLWADQLVSAKLKPQLGSLASECQSQIERALPQTPRTLRMHASHGFAVALLPALMNRLHGTRLDLQFVGSLSSLKALQRGDCDVAGFHVPEGELAAAVLKDYAPVLDLRSQVLIHMARRSQGLFLKGGNPKRISGLTDLTRPDVQFVNRQPESGTRSLLDKMLIAAGIPPAAISGYNIEEFTHAAVAAFVASGMADTGLGVETAARQFDLDFLPLANERYFLLCPRKALKLDPIMALIDVLKSEEFHKEVAKLRGYESVGAGRVLSLPEAFPEIAELR